VGLKLGERWDTDPRLRTWFHRFDAVIGVAILAAVVWFVWSRWQHRVRAPKVEHLPHE
jgi:heme A synthase